MSDDEDLFEEAMHTLGTKRTARAAPRPGKALPPGVTVSEDLDFDALMRSDGRGPAPDLSNAKPKAPPIEAAPTAAPLPAAPITTKRYSATPQEIAEFDRAMRELGSPPPDHPDLALAPAIAPTNPSEDLARLLKRGEIDTEAVLDLHGRTLKEARPKLATFIREARTEGWQLVTIIVGRGHHSDRGEAILRPAVEQWLRDEHRGDVREVLPAPPHMGGTGAWIVAIRARPPEKPQR